MRHAHIPAMALEFLDRSRSVATADYDRWRVPPAALAIHLSIGQAYAFSVFNLPLSTLRGITTSAPDDWKLSTIGWIFSVAIAFLGISAFTFGRWLEAGTMHVDWALRYDTLSAAMVGMVSFIAMLAFFYGGIWLIERNRDSSMGVVYLLGFTFFMGLLLGPLLARVGGLRNGAELVMLAAGGTAAVFFGMWIGMKPCCGRA